MRKVKFGVFCVAVCLVAAVSFAQTPALEPIVANQNRIAAGHLENGALTVHLELREGIWHPEAEDGPALFVQAFGENAHPAQIPAPMLRMPTGTTVHVTITNQLEMKATVFGLNTRPGDTTAGVELAAGESRELTFAAGAPGTYYYYARTANDFPKAPPVLADAQLNGAYIVDPAGAVPADRVFIIDAMRVRADVFHDDLEILSINGKSYPYTEPLEYTQGERIRWRVINTGFGEHPMHLHGAFFQVLSLGDFESDIAYAEGERQSVVTQALTPYHTMMLEWTPQHAGRWLFHCHFHAHISADERVPTFVQSPAISHAVSSQSETREGHDGMAMPDMAGLVLAINVKPADRPAHIEAASTRVPRKIDLVIEPSAVKGKSPTFSCSVREGKKLVVSEDKSMGPPIVVTRGEATEITVLNHLDQPTTIHWHGLELDSYYDGVMGGGSGNQITPMVAPGSSFTARFTPNRAGTFIYHTHAGDPNQIPGGVYGPLIVVEPGQAFDPEHDKVLVIGTHDLGFYATEITLNGTRQPAPLQLKRGEIYRLRVINMGSEFQAALLLGGKEHPANWLAVAKDGAALPPRLAKTGEAKLRIDSGETYDFEFRPEATGEIPLEIENRLNHAKLATTLVVQ